MSDRSISEHELDVLTDVHEHVRVISELMQRHVPEERRPAYRSKLDDIVRRSTDPNLHLAVIGEFSSGKSTFINALLRMPLLKASCVATTASVTRIRKGPSLTIAVDFVDDRTITATANDYDALRRAVLDLQPQAAADATLKELLDRLTSDAEVANYVRWIDVAIPSEQLDEHVVILDTPGINAGTAVARNHAEVTQRVLSDTADCALVLTSATQATSRTLLDFLKSHARPFLHRCIFVITAVDRLDEAERDAVRELVCTNLREKLGLELPVVLESAAIVMLPSEPEPDDARRQWQSAFRVLETTIVRALRRERILIIAERLIRLLQELVAEMERELARAAAGLDDEERVLRENGVAAIEQVLDSLRSRSTTDVERRIRDLKFVAQRERNSHVGVAKDYVHRLLDRAGSAIRSYAQLVHPEVARAVEHYGRNYTSILNRELDALRLRCQELSAEFARQFEKTYRELPSLGVAVPVPEVFIGPAPDPAVFRAALAHAAQQGLSDERQGNTGAAVGWTTSTILLGWLGGAVGALIGLFFGVWIGSDVGCGEAITYGFFGLITGAVAGVILTALLGAAIGRSIGSRGPALEERGRELRKHLGADIEAFFAGIHDAFDASAAAAVRDVTGSFSTAVERHIAQYGAAVERLRREHEQRQRTVAAMLATIRADANDLTQRAARLDSLRHRLARSSVPA
jgi:predicted GTPase